MSNSYVNKIQVGTDTHLIQPTLYGTSNTTAATGTKNVTLPSFKLITGAQVAIKFSNTNTAAAANLKLKFNSESDDNAKPIKYRGANLPAVGTLAAGRVYNFVYDGANWELVGDLDTNTWNALSTSQAGYVSQAPNDTTKFLCGDASWAQVDWGDLTNVPSTFAPSAHEHNYIGKDGFIAYPSDGRYTTSTSTVTGYIKIKIPQTKSMTMFTFDVDIYNYITSTSTRYHIGGYNYNDASWNNCVAYCIAPLSNTKANLTVRFLSNGNDEMYVTIGQANTSWSYPQVTIHNIAISFSSQATLVKWKSGWTVTIDSTAFDDSLVKQTITNTNIAYTTQINTAAPIASGKIGYFAITPAISGSNTLLAQESLYIYNTIANNAITNTYLCVGKQSSIKGGITLQAGNSYYGDLITASLTANRTYTLPDATGTIALSATTLNGYGITNAVQYNGIDNDIGSSATATNAKAYWANNNKVPKGKIVFNYNSSGTEYTTLFSNNNNSHGSILRWGYSDNYIRILRAHPNQTTYNGWYTEDWEKISAGYADSAGKATNDADGNAIKTTYAKLASPTFTGTPKSVTPTSSSDGTMIATKAYVDGILSANNAMTFKGTLGTGGDATALPDSHTVGDTYRVITAGDWAGKTCVVGDLIICTNTGTTANNADWTSVETNEDGAVIGPAAANSTTNNAIVRWNSTTGRVIKNSDVTIDDSNNISGIKTLTISDNSGINNHLNFSRTGGHTKPSYINVPASSSLAFSVGGAGGANIIAMIDPEGIVPYSETTTKTIGTSTYKWAAVYATNFYGDLEGNADIATTANALKNINPNTGSGNRPTNVNTAITHVNNGGVQHIKIADSTNNVTGHLLHFHWDTGDSWDGQLLLPNNSSNSSMKWRSCSAANTWDSWRTLLDSSNYSSYALPVSGGTLGKSNTIDNTAFKNNLILYSNQSNESTVDAFDATKSSWGIGFQRKWNNGTEGAATHAGIYAYGIANWRTGLVFRTKTGISSSATHDVSALILNHNADAVFSGNISLSDATKSIVRDGSSINWNQANTRAMIRMITKAGWSPLFSLKADTGWWNMGHYNSSGFNNHLLFTFLNDNDVSGVSGAQNHMDYTVRLIPVVHTDSSTTDRVFVTTPWANSSAAVGNATQPVYIDDNGVATACATTTVSNAWSVASNDTTKKIPMISTTVNGVTGTAVAIPEASTSAGGIVTIGTQSFGGSKTFIGDTFEIRADVIRLRNKSNNNNAVTNQPYVTSLIIGDSRYINFTEYKDDHLVINSKSILLDTTSNGITAYDPSKTYSLNAIVWYDRSYYYCSTAITEAEVWNSAHWTAMPASNIMANASFVPWKNNSYALGSSSYRWSKVYIGTADSYGNDTTPIYWNNGVPKACTSYANASVNYATSAGSAGTATAANALNFTATNEILIGNTNSQAKIYINHRRVADGATTGNTAITDYYFRNGNASQSGVTIHAANFDGLASKATGDADGNAINTTYLKLSGGTMTGTIILNSSGVSIKQKLNDASNYGTPIYWNKTTEYTETYKPSLGFHNVGDTNGNIIILPYATNSSPWNNNVGLQVGKNTLKWEAAFKATSSNGRLSATQIGYHVSFTEKAYSTYNTSDDSIDFIFL